MERRRKADARESAELDELRTQLYNDASSAAGSQLPPRMRKLMEKRRRELLAKYPDFVSDPQKYASKDGPPMRLSTRLDLIVIGIGMLVLAALLYSEYRINVAQVAYDSIVRALDPGPRR